MLMSIIWYIIIATIFTLYFLWKPVPQGFSEKEDILYSIFCGITWPLTLVVSLLILAGVIRED